MRSHREAIATGGSTKLHRAVNPFRRDRRGTRPQRVILTSLWAAAVLAVLLWNGGTALASTESVAACRLTFHVRVHRISPTGRTSRYTSSSGTVACSGSLGPWFMNGDAGSASSAGTLDAAVAQPGHRGQLCRVISGGGTFQAAAPEFTFSIPPAVHPTPLTVPMTASFQLSAQHQASHVTAFGSLGPPPPGFIAVSGFSLTGPSALVPDHGNRCGSERWTATLVLKGAVWSSYEVG